jgi:hypothetical protein
MFVKSDSGSRDRGSRGSRSSRLLGLRGGFIGSEAGREEGKVSTQGSRQCE